MKFCHCYKQIKMAFFWSINLCPTAFEKVCISVAVGQRRWLFAPNHSDLGSHMFLLCNSSSGEKEKKQSRILLISIFNKEIIKSAFFFKKTYHSSYSLPSCRVFFFPSSFLSSPLPSFLSISFDLGKLVIRLLIQRTHQSEIEKLKIENGIQKGDRSIKYDLLCYVAFRFVLLCSIYYGRNCVNLVPPLFLVWRKKNKKKREKGGGVGRDRGIVCVSFIWMGESRSMLWVGR